MKIKNAIILLVFFMCFAAPCITCIAKKQELTEDKKHASENITLLEKEIDMTWPLGTATPSEVCGICHKSIYREYAMGFGSDILFGGIVYKSAQENLLELPSNVSTSGTAHSLSGVDPYPIHARGEEEEGKSCNVCHFPEPFEITDISLMKIPKPIARPVSMEQSGLTCASCHLTPEGKIRGPYGVKAPHDTVVVPGMQTSAMCAYCHALGERVSGKQTQTFFEWREDFYKPGLGLQHCQDCHMPRTIRKLAENYDVPERVSARHLWTGGHSKQRVMSALNLVIIQPHKEQSHFEFHVINIGAGHSVPTGSNRRGIYLQADILDIHGNIVTTNEWMFAPWYGNRPDDKAFLEEDRKRPDAVAVMQADEQGPHEAPIRAGEERVLSWSPALNTGNYTVQARLVYDLNRYNEKLFGIDQTEMYRSSLFATIGK